MRPWTVVGPVSGLRFFFAHHGTFNPDNNLLYAIDATEDYSETTNLVVIDAATHSIVNTMPTVNELHTVAFIPTGIALPPSLSSAASRKVHNVAGTFDLALSSPPLDPTTEPRLGAAGGNHTIVFTFQLSAFRNAVRRLIERMTARP